MTDQIPFSQSTSYTSQTLILNNKNNDNKNKLTFLIGADLWVIRKDTPSKK